MILVALLGVGSCARCTPAPHDVILITVDTLRADHLGLYGYPRETSPHIDRWFKDALAFRRAYATEAATPPSAVSILTGRLPQNHRVRLFYQIIPDETVTLADHFRAAGYQTAAVVSNAVLTHEATGLGTRFDHFDDFVDERESPDRQMWERNARRTTDAALRWLELERDANRPFFLWVHYMDPHGPYRPPADRPTDFSHEGSQPFEPVKHMLDYQIDIEVKDALEYVDRYDEEIAYCDREIGRFLEGLFTSVSDESAVVAFTADHGETMAEHEIWFAHQFHVYEPVIRVPLAIRGPSVRGEWIDGPVSLVDLAPTLLELAHVDAQTSFDGRSLLDRAGTREVAVEATDFEGAAQYRALLRGGDKWVIQLDRKSATVVKRWRYRIEQDVGETNPLPWSAADERNAAALVELIATDPDPAGVPHQHVEGMLLEAPKVRPGLHPHELEKLRSLGYAR